MNKNYGLDIKREREEQDGTELLAGALPTCRAKGLDELPFEEMKAYFPKGEIQRSDKDDMMDCASRDKNNFLESKMNFLLREGLLTDVQESFIRDNGYLNSEGDFESSDAFIAIKSGTTRQGNSLKAPLQAIHDHGLIPKSMLPLEPWMTFDDYHNPARITKEMEDLGEKFMAVVGEIFYGQEYDYEVKKGVVVGLFAWPPPDNRGIYQSTENRFNHAVYRPAPKHYVFDNYIDSHDGDFVKTLAPDYRFMEYAYEIVIGPPKGSLNPNRNWFTNIFRSIWQFIIDFLTK